MKTFLTTSLGSLLFLAVGTAAHAQLPNSRPPVSPFLNLYRGGQSGNLNYYNLVRPEIDFRSSIQQLQSQSNTNQQAIADLTTTAGPLVTGHAAGFMTQRSYFQTAGAAGTAGTGATATGSKTTGRTRPTGAR